MIQLCDWGEAADKHNIFKHACTCQTTMRSTCACARQDCRQHRHCMADDPSPPGLFFLHHLSYGDGCCGVGPVLKTNIHNTATTQHNVVSARLLTHIHLFLLTAATGCRSSRAVTTPRCSPCGSVTPSPPGRCGWQLRSCSCVDRPGRRSAWTTGSKPSVCRTHQSR